MDFGFSEEQEELRKAIREVLSREFPISFARSVMETGSGWSSESWRRFCALGWTGLSVPEEFGGSGLRELDLVLALEEAGAVALPGPYASTVSLTLPLLLAVGTQAELAEVVPGVVSGERRVACALAEKSGRWEAEAVQATAVRDADGFVLTGRKMFVPDAIGADLLLVVTQLEAGLGVFLLPSGCPGVVVTPMQTVDTTQNWSTVELGGARVEANGLLGGRLVSPDSLNAVLDHAKIATAAQMVGAADRALTLTVEYLGLREQFGRALATFQALQHRCADMKVSVEHARSLVYYAAWAWDTGAPDRRIAAAMAKAFASQACPNVAADAVQLHGGIGFTWEHDLHIYFKRLKADEHIYGGATANRELVAKLLEETA